MIETTEGNLLRVDAEALVNTVNCIGHMGKGIALQFKKAFPENFKAYAKVCRAHELHPGKMFIFRTGMLGNPKFVINFPTKRHWRGKAKIDDVRAGLSALVCEIRQLEIESVAIPPLGCGLGGLNWSEIRPMIEEAFHAAPEVRVLLFEPRGAPEARTMPVRTERPKMTPARALFLKLMDQYRIPAYRLTLLEIHKLAYFLQEAGEKLRLRYGKGYYGPYAENLNKVLEVMEGHFIRGYGDSQKPDVEIDLLPDGVKEADKFLEGHDKSKARLQQVADLIEGFETPYGMELLSSVHWVTKHDEPSAKDENSTVEAVHRWNQRKHGMLKSEHIRLAYRQFQEQEWL